MQPDWQLTALEKGFCLDQAKLVSGRYLIGALCLEKQECKVKTTLASQFLTFYLVMVMVNDHWSWS